MYSLRSLVKSPRSVGRESFGAQRPRRIGRASRRGSSEPNPPCNPPHPRRTGVAESGLFPGIVFYLAMWYKRNGRQFRVALFFSAALLAGAFGGVLAWGIAHMRGVGGYNGWRWIFIL